MRALAGLAVVGVLTLTACNDDTASSDTATTAAPTSAAASTEPSAPATSAAAPTAAAPTSSAAAPATGAPVPGGNGGGQTPAPGTTVKVGDAVQIPFSSGSTKGAISLAVTSIDQGDPADLAPFKLGDRVKGLVPYYIHYKITNVGTTDLSFTSVTHMKGLLADGTEATDLGVIGTFDKCPNNSLPKGFTNGQSSTSCAVALSPSASKVAGAEYWGEPYTLNKGINWKS
ncbi:hypothetical protein F7Q99_15635 [Streptomyces kaniharaensis]|uniref:DUF4352 domain-containing protein n=1 Tax=Streptomyces kaniharaensis TaxID=212423 RepID=A0A6N7KUH7_9ACTN|nr:hypothetical protein [Streptomyces kaniharaensis]MQS13664.1 hypothetical protein [Streptomyces kaniharaensis]